MAEEKKQRLVNRVQTTKMMRELSNNFYDDLKRAPSQGRKVCWTFGPVPFEPLRVMNIAFQHFESYGAYVAARKAHGELKEVAHSVGYSPDMCSYARIIHGRLLLEDRGELGRMRPDIVNPRPDFVFGVNLCQTMTTACDSVARVYNIPSFILDVPYIYNERDQALIKRNHEFVTRQLRDEFIPFLEEITGQRFDNDKLKYILELDLKAAILRKECFDLCKAIPGPMTGFDWFISLGPVNYLRGSEESVTYYQALKEELKDRVAKGIGAIPNERHRLYWDNLAIWFKVGELSEKLAAWGANLIAGEYIHLGQYRNPDTIDPEHPIETMAGEMAINHGMVHSIEHKIEKIAKLVEDYSINGLVICSHRTCRPFDIGQHDLIDGMARRLGVPGVMIEADPTDETCYSEAQVDTRLQAFLEMLEARRKYQR